MKLLFRGIGYVCGLTIALCGGSGCSENLESPPLEPQPERAGYGRIAYTFDQTSEWERDEETRVEVLRLHREEVIFSDRVRPPQEASFLQYDALLSRDGSRLFYSGEEGAGRIQELESDSAEEVVAPEPWEKAVVIPRALSADGHRALFLWLDEEGDDEANDPQFGLWRDGAVEPLSEHVLPDFEILSADLSADGTTVALLGMTPQQTQEGEVFVYRVTVLDIRDEEITRRHLATFDPTALDVTSLSDDERPRNLIAISDDAYRLAALVPEANERPEYVLHTIEDGESTSMTRYSVWAGPLDDVELSPQGTQIVLTARSTVDSPPQLISFSYSDPYEPKIFPENTSQAAWSPDGQNLAMVYDYVFDEEDYRSVVATHRDGEDVVLVSEPDYRVHTVSWGWD